MTVAHTAKAGAARRGDKSKTKGSGSMSGGEVRINVTSNKAIGWIATRAGLVLSVLGGGFLAIVVHIWDDVDKHLDKLDTEIVALSITQGKVEQFFTNELPGLVRDIKANSSSTLSLAQAVKQIQSDQATITATVSKLQDQVSASALDVQRLKDAAPLQRQRFEAPRPTSEKTRKL